jgi:hypothetical protein
VEWNWSAVVIWVHLQQQQQQQQQQANCLDDELKHASSENDKV